MWSSLK
ncbi:hypothetical protein AB6A40_000472 [Gnathostoma spinigerum]